MRKFLVALLVVVSPMLFIGNTEARKEKRLCANTKILLDEVALNGAASTRTFTEAGLDGFDILTLATQFTHANNGTLTFTCTFKSPVPAAEVTAAKRVQADVTPATCTVASGACTLNITATWATASLSGDTDFSFPIGVAGETSITCVVAHGGTPAAGDKITVVGRKCTGG